MTDAGKLTRGDRVYVRKAGVDATVGVVGARFVDGAFVEFASARHFVRYDEMRRLPVEAREPLHPLLCGEVVQ